MIFRIVRTNYGENVEFCEGVVLLNNDFFCYSLEDKVRNLTKKEDKVPGKTAIPEGFYSLTVTMSNRFKKEMPLVENVPFFEGIRLHGGLDTGDTEGCPLLMPKRGLLPGTLSGSILTNAVTQMLKKSNEKHFLQVINAKPT